MTVNNSGQSAEVEKRIETHLKKVYEDSMKEPMSDRLASLVAQLKSQSDNAK